MAGAKASQFTKDTSTMHSAPEITPAVATLIAWRHRNSLTQTRAAEILCVPPRTLQHWELSGRCALPGLLSLALAMLESVDKPPPA